MCVSFSAYVSVCSSRSSSPYSSSSPSSNTAIGANSCQTLKTLFPNQLPDFDALAPDWMHVVSLGASSMGLQFEEDYEDDADDADEASHDDEADDADKDQLRCSLRRLKTKYKKKQPLEDSLKAAQQKPRETLRAVHFWQNRCLHLQMQLRMQQGEPRIRVQR